MAINIESELVALPGDPWATTTQFTCNEATRCGGSPCPSTYVSPWTDDEFLAWATSILFNATGRRFSTRTRTITPQAFCGCSRADLSSVWTTFDRLPFAENMARSMDPCAPICNTCGQRPIIDLGGNVSEIVEVRVDSAVVDPTKYRVDDRRWLVRVAEADGTNPGWNLDHRLDVVPMTMSVTFKTGITPPIGSAHACVSLACALRQMMDSQGNTGPLKGQTVNSMSTRGMSATVEGLLTGLRKGKSGIGPVDVFLATWLVREEDVNGNNIAPGGRVWSPDLEAAQPVEITWQP